MTNITNIVNDMSITPTEDIPEKKTPGREKILKLQEPVRVRKKYQNINPK